MQTVQQVLALALSHLRAGDEAMAAKVSENIADAPEGLRARLNWLHSLAAFDEISRGEAA